MDFLLQFHHLFQFTPLREGRLCRRRGLVRRMDFNSRPSARGDREAALMLANSFISIHAPPRGATWIAWRDPYYYIFQFTPLREGRLVFVAGLLVGRISIHAPPRGATLLPTRRKPMQTNFNSRPSARGDERKKGKQASAGISIHAPPRGATSAKRASKPARAFQFTPLREGRRGVISPLSSCVLFQFTPLREGRPRQGHNL